MVQSVCSPVCFCWSGGGGGGRATENLYWLWKLMDIEFHGQVDNENLIHFYSFFFIFYKFSCFLAYQKQQDFELLFRCWNE